MATQFEYVRGYLCACECAWTVDKPDPDICWFCGSDGPHKIMNTCHTDPYYQAVREELVDFLFADIYMGALVYGGMQ